MSRPLRLEFPGALYHVTARGNRLAPIFKDDHDRRAWMAMLRKTCVRFNFTVHAYCQMTNHFHLLLETAQGNLSRGMRHLNGVYSQHVNRRHGLVGHLFQGRYKAILVQRESHLLELARYIVLNPVRAGMVESPNQWDWSSYHWTAANALPPPWLHTDWLLGQFSANRADAVKRYREFVLQGRGCTSPLKHTKYQLILGDVSFVAEQRDPSRHCTAPEIAKSQRQHNVMSLAEFRVRYGERDEAMARAFRCGAYAMTEIASFFHVSCKTVGRAVRKYETATEAPSSPGERAGLPL
jgi:putative transposase